MEARTVHGSGSEKVLVRAGPRGNAPGNASSLPLLALLPLATFGPHLGKEFLVYDDDVYLTLNDTVRHGLTWAGVRWALTTGHAANWHPLTWVSHMADVTLFGMGPAALTRSTCCCTSAATILLFFLAPGRGSRGDRLGRRSVRGSPAARGVGRLGRREEGRFAWPSGSPRYGPTQAGCAGGARSLLVLLPLRGGLIAKPMLVSLPAPAPPGRLAPRTAGPRGEAPDIPGVARAGPGALILEKVPLFLMAAVSSVVTFLVQRAGGAVRSLESPSRCPRVSETRSSPMPDTWMLSGRRIWPSFIRIPGARFPHGGLLAAALLLAGLSAGALALRRRAPFLFVGWFCVSHHPLPVIGVVQVGYQALADRYTYFPFIGLFVAIAWGFPEIASRSALRKPGAQGERLSQPWPRRRSSRQGRRVSGTTARPSFSTRSRIDQGQFPRAQQSRFLLQRDRKSSSSPATSDGGRAIDPRKPNNHTNIGGSRSSCLAASRKRLTQFSQALRLEPGDAIVLTNLARTRFFQGEIPEAVRLYEAAIARAPEATEPRGRLAVALLVEGKLEAGPPPAPARVSLAPEAERIAAGSWRMSPHSDETRTTRLSAVSASFWPPPIWTRARPSMPEEKRPEAAFAHLRKAFELFPAFAAAYNELGTPPRQRGTSGRGGSRASTDSHQE